MQRSHQSNLTKRDGSLHVQAILFFRHHSFFCSSSIHSREVWSVNLHEAAEDVEEEDGHVAQQKLGLDQLGPEIDDAPAHEEDVAEDAKHVPRNRKRKGENTMKGKGHRDHRNTDIKKA